MNRAATVIANTAGTTGFISQDTGSQSITIQSFTFFTTARTTIYVGTNGYITFTTAKSVAITNTVTASSLSTSALYLGIGDRRGMFLSYETGSYAFATYTRIVASWYPLAGNTFTGVIPVEVYFIRRTDATPTQYILVKVGSALDLSGSTASVWALTSGTTYATTPNPTGIAAGRSFVYTNTNGSGSAWTLANVGSGGSGW